MGNFCYRFRSAFGRPRLVGKTGESFERDGKWVWGKNLRVTRGEKRESNGETGSLGREEPGQASRDRLGPR